MRIAILDDDRIQNLFVCGALAAEGHICCEFYEGRALVKQLRRQTFDLLILDWNIPDMSGEEILHWVRNSLSTHLPVIFMSSRARDEDVTTILNHGADDYVVKPVSANILVARIESLLRRTYQMNSARVNEVHGNFEFDLVTKKVLFKGEAVNLTHKEFELGLLLLQHLGRPLSRSHILDVIWKQAPEVTSRTVDTHISSLRTKLGLRPENGYRLTPIYGHGYRLDSVSKDVVRMLPVKLELGAHCVSEGSAGSICPV